MADHLAHVKVRWLDDTAFLEDDPKERLKLFLDSIGITSEVAIDILQVILMAKARELTLKTAQIKQGIDELRIRQGIKEPKKGLTDRNIQIWIGYYEDIGLLERHNGRHRFRQNKRPIDAFKQCKQMVTESLKVSERLLERVEEGFSIR